VRPARRTLFKTIGRLDPWCFVAKFRYQSRVLEQVPKSQSLRFFRPLLYQLSYLGETSILLGIPQANRIV